AVWNARRHASKARFSIRRGVHRHGHADIRGQHVSNRFRFGSVREARRVARRRTPGLARLARWWSIWRDAAQLWENTRSAADGAACARKIVTSLATRAFRRRAAPADVNLLMTFYEAGRKESGFDKGIEQVLARVLASPKFIYRIEAEPANLKVAEPYRLSDPDLASRLSFFLWSSGPDNELINLASQGRLKDPMVLE